MEFSLSVLGGYIMNRILAIFTIIGFLCCVPVEAADLMRDFYLGEPIEQVANERKIEYTHHWTEGNCDVYITYLGDEEDKKLVIGSAKADIRCYRIYVQDDKVAGLSAHFSSFNWTSWYYSDFKWAISQQYGEPIGEYQDYSVIWQAGDNFIYMLRMPIDNNRYFMSISIIAPSIAAAMVNGY